MIAAPWGQDALTLLQTLIEQGVAFPESPHSREEVASAESLLGVDFPPDYRAFVERYGYSQIGTVSVFGISKRRHLLPSVEFAVKVARSAWPAFPRDLIPIQTLGKGVFYCLRCRGESDESVVTRWPPITASSVYEPVFPDFGEFLGGRIAEAYWKEDSVKVFDKHITWYDEHYLSKGKLPRSDVWRPHQFCVQNVFIGFTVFRHALESNSLLIDVCMTFDPLEFEPWSGTKMMAVTLLSEAYKSGGSLELRFTGNVEGGRVPRALTDLALWTGIRLRHLNEGRICPEEAKRLYLAISDLPLPVFRRLNAQGATDLWPAVRACFAIHHGIWTKGELESIVLASPDSDAILAGVLIPEERGPYLRGLALSRAALLGGWLHRRLTRRERTTSSGEALELEDDIRNIEASFEASAFGVEYTSKDDEVFVPWNVVPTVWKEPMRPSERFLVLLRGRDRADIQLSFEADLSAALGCLRLREESGRVAILYPRDFENVDEECKQRFIKMAEGAGIAILVCPESAFALDMDSRRRFEKSRIMRS